MKSSIRLTWLSALAGVFALLALSSVSVGQVYNLKVVTDASPDYSDMDSMIHSISSKWSTPAEKCWAMFYWNHIARRQTEPMCLHGLELTDPIRQFNDYGYTQCSTIAGINCAIWDAMGLKAKFWDIHVHTVAEVFYEDVWHMHDNSLSALYTRCDGKTLAGVEEIGAEGACSASSGKKELGHIAKYHCLTSTSRNGFLQGADCARSLDEESRCFRAPGLLYRSYYYNWDRGHRYILNLRPGEVYTRHFTPLDRQAAPASDKFVSDRRYYVPNPGENGTGKADPEAKNPRYHIRGTGVWTFKPSLAASEYLDTVHQSNNIAAFTAGLRAEKSGIPAEAVFRVQAANVIASQTIQAKFGLREASDRAAIFVSTTNGLKWQEVWKSAKPGDVAATVDLLDEVSGAYEVLVKVQLSASASGEGAVLKGLEIETRTMFNSKTQPRLNLGKNTVYVGAGEPTESMVFWPDLQGTRYKELVVEEKNIKTAARHQGWNGCLFQERGGQEAYLVYRMDAPGDLTRITYGGRFFNHTAKAHTDLLHSFDGGKSWTKAYSMTKCDAPFDVIHYETVTDIPAGTRSVLFKYSLNSDLAGIEQLGLYAVRMEANYKPAAARFKPIEVTYAWKERQKDFSLVSRSHTQRVEKLPFTYTINVGGEDHPVMDRLQVSLSDAGTTRQGYSDGKDVGGQQYVPHWVTYGKNLALGKPYTVSEPSRKQWGSGDPEGKKLTDGTVGPNYAGPPAPNYGPCWEQPQKPVIDVDLGSVQACRAFRIHLSAGWPWWDAAKGEVQDKVEVFTSEDGKDYSSRGLFDFAVRKKNLPVNFMFADDETATGFLFDLVLDKAVNARHVRFKITPRRILVVSEVQVLDEIQLVPFDLRLALPDQRPGT